MRHRLNKARDVDYIGDQSQKWHVSPFNGKSPAVPVECRAAVDRWLRPMGYRYGLLKFRTPDAVEIRMTQGRLITRAVRLVS